MKDKKILLLGSTGLLGSAFKSRLSELGFDFVAPNRAELDLLNEKQVIDFLKSDSFDFVINASGYNQVDKAEVEQDLCFKLNAGVPGLLAKVLADSSKGKLIQFSSDYVFDGLSEGGYKEDSETNPLSVYGKSKEMGEKNVLEYENSLVIRISWLFGPFAPNFITTILAKYEESSEIKVVNDQFGKPTYTFDVVDSVLKNAEKEFGILHLPNETICSWYDLAKYALQKRHNNPKIEAVSCSEFVRPAKRPLNSVLINSKVDLLRPGFEAVDDYLDKFVL